MTTLHVYLAQDRLRALASGESLPSRTTGSALFADISGFTALTEALRNSLGARRGAEELTRRIEAVYSALITQIELFGGSVIEFAGDSMLCWFDDDLSLVAEIESPDAINQSSGAQRALCSAHIPNTDQPRAASNARALHRRFRAPRKRPSFLRKSTALQDVPASCNTTPDDASAQSWMR